MKKNIPFFYITAILLITGCGKKDTPGPVSAGNKNLNINSISPVSGAYNTVVTITGSNFDPVASNNVVKFNKINATVQSATSTKLTALVPLGAGSGAISVATNTLPAVTGPVFTYNLSTIVISGGVDNLNHVYWANDTEHVLSGNNGNTAGGVYTMAISGTDIYFGGTDGSNASYWKSDSRYDLPFSGATSSVAAMAISGSDIYFAGLDSHMPAYWKNSTEYLLPFGNGTATAPCAITIAGPDLYIAGNAVYAASNPVVYWKNAIEYNTVFSNSAVVKTLAVSGTDVYLAGYDQFLFGSGYYGNAPVYWKNGSEYRLPISSSAGGAVYSVAISGNNVYFAGSDGLQAVYWMNGAEITLHSTDVTGANIVAIAISGSDLYFAGHDGSSAVYWKNGIEYSLPSQGFSGATVNAIGVTVK